MVAQPLSTPIELLVITGTDEDGRVRVMRLTGAAWTPDQLGTVAGHAGVRITPGSLSATDFERLAPGTMPMRYRRPLLFAGAIGIALVLTVIADYLLLT